MIKGEMINNHIGWKVTFLWLNFRDRHSTAFHRLFQIKFVFFQTCYSRNQGIVCRLHSIHRNHSYFSKVVKAQREFMLSFTCVVTPRTLLADSHTQSKGGVFNQSGAAGWLDNIPDSKHWFRSYIYRVKSVKIYTLASMSWCNPASGFHNACDQGWTRHFF